MKLEIGKLTVLAAALAVADVAAAATEMYIPLGAANRVQVVDVATSRVTGVIENVTNVHGLAITPDRRYLVAGSLTERPAGGETAPARPPGMSKEEHAQHHGMKPGGSPTAPGTSDVSIIDTASRRVARRIAVRGAVHHVAVSPDGRFAVATHPGAGGISVIDLEQFRVAATVQTGPAPNYVVFTTGGDRVYVSNAGDNSVSEVAVGTWSVSRRIVTGKAPGHMVLARDDRTLYVNNVADGTVSVIAIASGGTARTYRIGAAPHGIDLSDDGGTLYATSRDDNRLVAVDLESGNVRRVALGPAPYHVTAVRGSDLLYVSSRGANRVWILNQRTLARQGEVAIGGIGHQMVMAAR